MRILLAADQYPDYHNGAGAFTEHLAAGLAGRGHSVTVAYPSAHGAASSSGRGGLRDERLTSRHLPLGHGVRFCTPATARRDARRLLNRSAVDVVHVQSHLPVGRAFLAAAAAQGIPTVATNHFMPENLVAHLPIPDVARRWVGARSWRDLAEVYARADVLTTPTLRAAELLTARTGLDRVEVISNGVDLAGYQPVAPRGGEVPVVLFVGRLEPEKRVEDLLRAFAALPADPPVRLVYIGTGSRYDALRTLANEHRVGDRVEFWGNVAPERLRRAYAECSVFCAPGVAELQSLVTLEAVASGAPVVAADAVALPHLVHHGRNGFRYPPDRPELLTEQLRRLLDDPELRRRMGAQSRVIAQLHDFETTLDRYLECYARVTAADPALVAAAGSRDPDAEHRSGDQDALLAA
jgi:glycosyltransferase involved in cell wall biosynthesis